MFRFLREPKHVGASIIILKLFKHFYDFIIVCISWNNKKCFSSTDIALYVAIIYV
jgi:hypothetical protein